jgi:hypothetical protein
LKASYRRNDDHCGSAPATQLAVDSTAAKNSASVSTESEETLEATDATL